MRVVVIHLFYSQHLSYTTLHQKTVLPSTVHLLITSPNTLTFIAPLRHLITHSHASLTHSHIPNTLTHIPNTLKPIFNTSLTSYKDLLSLHLPPPHSSTASPAAHLHHDVLWGATSRGEGVYHLLGLVVTVSLQILRQKLQQGLREAINTEQLKEGRR